MVTLSPGWRSWAAASSVSLCSAETMTTSQFAGVGASKVGHAVRKTSGVRMSTARAVSITVL